MPPFSIDIIILSYARSPELRALTEQTIQSLLNSEDPQKIQFHICVIESQKNIPAYNYPNTETLWPTEKFGYHLYMNIGIRRTHSQYLALCNNDLLFFPSWATAILEAMKLDPELMSAGTWCNLFHTRNKVSLSPTLQYGYTNGILVTGWCIFVKREIFNLTGPLDEKLKYWYCDDDYRKTLESKGIKHALITNSRVDHLTSQTAISLDKKSHRKMSIYPLLYYDFKWNHKSQIIYLLKKIWFWFKIQFNLFSE